MTDYAYALAEDLVPCDVPLGHLYLDPNNPRFVGSNWITVPEESITNAAVQDEAARRLKSRYDVAKLRANMEVNGFLPIDRVVVKRIDANTFLILEGNRRICAAKELKILADRDQEVPEEIRNSVSQIPCLEYTGDDPMAAWTFQGLRHISGVNDWPAFNKAKLLVTQMEEEGLSLTDVGKRFGLTAFGAGQWVRGYYAFQQAGDETDYSDEIDERCYPLFQEFFGRSSIPIREWLDWDDSEYQFKNSLRLNEFASWLYPRPEEAEADAKGSWDDRRIMGRDDLRRLSYVLRNNKELFELFRRGDVDVEAAYAQVLAKQHERSLDRTDEVFGTLEMCVEVLSNVPFKMLRDAQLSDRLKELLEKNAEAISELRDAMS